MSADWFVMISGCSGGGKSTLIEELARRGGSSRMCEAGEAAGYDTVILPRDTVTARADFVLETLERDDVR